MLKLYQEATESYICEKILLKKLSKGINYRKVRDHCHDKGKSRVTTHSTCNLKFNVYYEMHLVFHNRLNYDYHFVIKELANEFQEKIEYLGKNSEK